MTLPLVMQHPSCLLSASLPDRLVFPHARTLHVSLLITGACPTVKSNMVAREIQGLDERWSPGCVNASGISGKQEQELNSPNLGTAF